MRFFYACLVCECRYCMVLISAKGVFQLNIEKKLKIELCFISILIVCAVLSLIFGFFGWLKPAKEPLENWFMRSGAIVSIFSTLACFKLNSFLEQIRGGSFSESWVSWNKFINHQVVVSWIATVIGILGAVIWGYGDLVFKLLFI